MDDIKQSLQKVFHHEIPLSREIGISVVDYKSTSLTLQAPLDRNINHKSTAFGGSLYSVAVLSGWGLLYLLLQKQGLSGHIVIHESQVKYHRPVRGDILSTATIELGANLQRFIKLFERSGKARINVHAQIFFESELAVDFHGQYVVHK